MATVYRCATGTVWRELGRLQADGSGNLAFLDRDVSQGERYGYRLGVLADGREFFAGEVWVSVPEAVLSLEGVRPNPTSGSLAATLEIPEAGNVRLEVLDIAGRVVETRRLWLEPGRHVVPLAPPNALPPGVYTVRMRYRGLVAQAAAVVLR